LLSFGGSPLSEQGKKIKDNADSPGSERTQSLNKGILSAGTINHSKQAVLLCSIQSFHDDKTQPAVGLHQHI
jgi:hypothetical protein